jgi:hypothetical protein
MLRSKLESYQLQHCYFTAEATTFILGIDHDKFIIDVDELGRFLWNPDANFPGGVYANPVYPENTYKLVFIKR